eukprot:1325479-Alexandrium_andersonii.AAC.1
MSLPFVAVQHAQAGPSGHTVAPCGRVVAAQHFCSRAPPWASSVCAGGSTFAAAPGCPCVCSAGPGNGRWH